MTYKKKRIKVIKRLISKLEMELIESEMYSMTTLVSKGICDNLLYWEKRLKELNT